VEAVFGYSGGGQVQGVDWRQRQQDHWALAAEKAPTVAKDDKLRSAKHWREKADEARMTAEQMRNAAARAVMGDRAEKFERMAEHAAKRETALAAKDKESFERALR
jgi:hypothetical protein